MVDNTIIIVGAFHEIIELCESLTYRIIGIIDNNLSGSFMSYPIIGCDLDAASLYPKYGMYPLVITPDLPKIRKKLVTYYQFIGYSFATLISKSAYISPSVQLGEGIIVQNAVYISSNCHIGNFVKLNVGSTIMHDVVVNEFSTIAPASVTLGYVKIGNECYVGANSTILPRVKIGNKVTIGAGAVVTRDIENDQIVKGVPAK
ncbi:acetyltransferase [Bacteroidia bacterium]|nr:acetyltransferase [Bacteroidia bacterium]